VRRAQSPDTSSAWWPRKDAMVAIGSINPRAPQQQPEGSAKAAGLLQQWTFEDPSARVLQLLLFSPVGIAANQGGAALDLGALVDQVFGLA